MPRIVRQLSRRVAPAAPPGLSSRPFVPRSFTTTAIPSAAAAAPFRLPDNYIPPTQPPTARPPGDRKSQVIRNYTSLLRSTPLIIFFQHNNLTALEWSAVRRELVIALKAIGPVDVGFTDGKLVDLASNVRIQVLRGRMFDVAMRIVEFHTDKTEELSHDLSPMAYAAIKAAEEAKIPDSVHTIMEPLMSGPVAALCIPAVSPAYLAAALSILAPSPAFPAPTRRAAPGYHDPVTQTALAKLIMVGGRVEGKAFDGDGVAWVGGIKGGLGGLRAQVMYMLQNAGLGLVTALEGASKALYVSLESHRQNLEPKEENIEGVTAEEEKKE